MTDREYRDLLKRSHLCGYCKRQDAFTLAGRVLCAECAEKDRERQRRRRARDGGQGNRDRVRAAREAWRAEGMCSYCGKRKPEEGRALCGVCAARQRQRAHARKLAAGINWPRGENGFCWTCNKRRAMEGRRVCEVCFGIAVQNGEKGREKPRDGHGWKERIV